MSPPVTTRSALLNVRRTTRQGSKQSREVTVTNKAQSTRTKKSRRRGAPHRCMNCAVSCTNDKWSPIEFIIDHHDKNPECLESLFECQNPSCNYRGLTLSSLKMHVGSGRDKENAYRHSTKPTNNHTTQNLSVLLYSQLKGQRGMLRFVPQLGRPV